MKAFFSSFCWFFFLSASVFAQADPISRLSMDSATTRNFEIVVERSVEQARPTAHEVGILVERLCGKLDNIFAKYTPQRVAEEEAKKARKAGKQPKQPAKKTKSEEDESERVIPKCKIFIFNGKPQMDAKCRFDGLGQVGNEYAGFFTPTTNAIYMKRAWSLMNTRETILHEATHYYTENFLPAGSLCYPQWFREGLSAMYENHYWNGDKLDIGVPPRIQMFDAPSAGLKHLARFRDFAKNAAESSVNRAASTETAETNVATSGRPAKKSSSKKPSETPFDPTLIQQFLDTRFTPEILAADKIELESAQEAVAHRYAMYEIFGRFLLVGRPDLLEDILRQMALWEHEKDQTYPRDRWFVEAWKIVATDKPVTVEEMGRWLQKNQLPFQWAYGDWQDLGESIAGKANTNQMSILALSNPKMVPSFTVFPKVAPTFRVGVVINYRDRNNFAVVSVDARGNVLVSEQRAGTWNGAAKRIGTVQLVADGDHPYGGGPAFRFQLKRQGNMMGVQINGASFGAYPTGEKGCCGFSISDTEGIFAY